MSATSATATSIAKITKTIVANAGATVLTTFPAAPTVTKAAAASIFDPSRPNPVDFDVSNPLILFIVQAAVIVGFSRILAFFLKKIRQPQVIAEVIAGILIGPSVFGRIPGFTRRIFPPVSVPYLSLVANLGLVLFLFLVGLETDFSLFRRNLRASLSISLVGMVIPFALGAAVSVGIYEHFVSDSIKFGTFLLFLGVANAITAFPVLARILTELDMLQNHVGVVVLAAGVGNDVVGWVLLALAIALVNAASGIVILYILLTSVGWILALWFLGRPALVWLGRKTNSFGEKGPSQSMTCAVIFLVLTSAWVTDRIGIHAIFGGFLVGLIVPVEIRAPLTEKIEDLVSVLLLPLYFALSGLKTDLGLLGDGSIWGWTICVIVVAFVSKFVSCGVVAKLNGMDWRESGAVGSLMACKGLVELIVLNIGLNAGILNPQVFAMFVTMALVTTFLTTPLTLAFYPKHYRLQSEARHKAKLPESIAGKSDESGDDDRTRSRFTVVLEQFDHLPAVFSFVKLIKAPFQFSDADAKESTSTTILDEKNQEHPITPPSIAALRLIELSDRTSALLKASESEEALIKADTLTRIFNSYALGAGIPTKSNLSITSAETFSETVASHAAQHSSDVVVLPWALHGAVKAEEGVAGLLYNPLGQYFKGSNAQGSPQYATFVRKVFAEATCDVALFVDRGIESTSTLTGRSHIFFAFHGGADDRVALDFVVQLLAQNRGLSATVVHVERAAEPTADDHEALSTKATTRDTDAGATSPILFSQLTVHGGTATDTVYPTQHDLTSDTADALTLAKYFGESPSHITPAVTYRLTYVPLTTAQPLHLTIARARAALTPGTPLVLVAGRSRRGAPSHTHELADYLKENLEAVSSGIANSSEVRRSLGDVGTAYLVSGVGHSLFVVQSAGTGGVVGRKDA